MNSNRSWFDRHVLGVTKGSPRTVFSYLPFALSLSKVNGWSVTDFKLLPALSSDR
jgi:hypothetical protein